MADLRAWRDAAHELPPEGVPVFGILADGSAGWYERARDDDGAAIWTESDGVYWFHPDRTWNSDSAYHDDYTVRYWRPLPDVPTLAELDGAQGVDTTDADLDAFCGQYHRALRGLAAHPVGPAADAASGGGEG